MESSEIFKKLELGKIDAETLAKRAIKDHKLVAVLMKGLHQEITRVKYGCAMTLRILSDEEPKLLYGYFDEFVRLLENPNNIFRWEAIYVLSGLAAVDKENKIEGLLQEYVSPIQGPVMITACNLIKGLARIAKAKPQLAPAIAQAILRAEDGRYETAECYEIVIGNALRTFEKIYPLVTDGLPLIRFAEAHAGSLRPATRKSAEKFLAKYGDLSAVAA
jgi:hypothetical protein